MCMSARYDHEMAYQLSLISTWSYSDEETLRAVLSRDSVFGRAPEALKAFTVTNPALLVDANAYLISDSKDGPHVLSFRGTEPTNVIDWLTDALVEPHVWRSGDREQRAAWVHRGFFLSLDVLWPAISSALSELKGDLYITGHSLGGAIAALAGRRLLDEAQPDAGPKLRGVYTYGQPAVGNEVFCDDCQALKLPLYRHVHDQDLVPRLPPRGVGVDDFRHMGALYRSNRRRMWSLSKDHDAPSRCHISEVLPALLTLISARAQASSIPLLAISYGLRVLGLSLVSVREILKTLREAPELLTKKTLSMNDHIPSYYVDVSKSSVPGRVCERASPRAQG